MPDQLWINAVRAAGACQLLTLVCAHFTPIPRDWDRNLADLPDVHRRFAVAQNFFIGGVIAFSAAICLLLAPELVAGTLLARACCVGIALWWGGRLCVLPWLRVWPELRTEALRVGFALLHLECAAIAAGSMFLALRR